MAARWGFLTDNEGRLKLPGRHKVTRVFDADAGALPSGWTIGKGDTEDTGATPTWIAGTSGPPGLQIVSGVATGNGASLRRRAALFGASFDASKCAAVQLRCVFTGGATTNILPRLGFASSSGLSTEGVTLLHQVAADFCSLFVNGSGGSSNEEVSFKWVPAPARHVLFLSWIPTAGWLAIGNEQDAAFYMKKWNPVTQLKAGLVQPVAGATAQANGLTATAVIHRLELDMLYA